MEQTNQTKKPKRLKRTIKKGGKLKVCGWHWSSVQLADRYGEWVYAVEPADDKQQSIRVENEAGDLLAEATRGARIV